MNTNTAMKTLRPFRTLPPEQQREIRATARGAGMTPNGVRRARLSEREDARLDALAYGESSPGEQEAHDNR